MTTTITQTPRQSSERDESSTAPQRPEGSAPQRKRRGIWRAFSDAVQGSRYHVRNL